MSEKISDFITVTSLPDGSFIDLITPSENKKISKADLITAMGATGTLSQLGDPTGTPILNVVGTDNQIRNLEAGSGIGVSVSPTLGAEIKHNFIAGGEGTEVLIDITAVSPKIRGITGTAGVTVAASPSGDSVQISGSGAPLANRVIVTQASDLAGALDSSKEYFIDGIIDMGSQSVEVPQGGLNLTGYNFDVSKLTSTAAAYTMFTSPVGGSGNILGKDYAIEVTGAGSQVYNVTSDTGNEAFEFARINFNNCSSLGTITNYRQGLEVGTGRFGGKPELTLAGVWAGGYFIDTSIVRSLADGAYTLFKAGAGFAMASRFRSNQNVDLPALASFLDFSASNFANPSTLQLVGCIITRDGASDPEDSNLTPNITAAALSSAWSGNQGLPNTFVGGNADISTEVTTAISTINTFVDLAGTVTVSDLEHFDSPANGQLRHLGGSPKEFKVSGQFVLESSANNVVELKVVIFRAASTSFEDGRTVSRVIDSLSGGRDVGYFVVFDNITLNANDYVKFQVANTSGTSDITAELDSFFIVEAR